MANDFDSILDDILEQYDQPLQGVGEGRIARVKVDLGFVTDLSVFPRVFYGPEDYKPEEYNEAMAQARAKALKEAAQGRDPILTVRFLTDKANVLNKDTANWRSNELQETVIAWDRFLNEEGELENALRERVIPSVREHLSVEELGQWGWLHLKFGRTVYPKGEEEKGKPPQEWSGTGNFPYVHRKFASQEEALAAVEEGTPIDKTHQLHNMVERPEAWESDTNEGMTWQEWVSEIQGSIEAGMESEGYQELGNKPKRIAARKRVLETLVRDWGAYVPEEKLQELLEKYIEVTPAF